MGLVNIRREASAGGSEIMQHAYPANGTITGALLYPSFYWTAGNFTYSIPATGSTWSATDYPPGDEPSNADYSVFSASQAARFRAAIAIWDDLIAPNFTEVTEPAGQGNIRVAFTDVDDYHAGAWGYAYTPQQPPFSPSPFNGDIWVDNAFTSATFAAGTYDFEALLHEIGHAIGLKHSFEGGTVLPAEFDNRRYTVMSYTNPADATWMQFVSTGGGGISTSPSFVNPSTPMLFDVLAIQTRYGADTTTRTGADSYTFDASTPFFMTIYDAGGTDTINLSNQLHGSIVDLTPGSYSSIGHWTAAEQTTYWQSQFNPGFSSFIADQLDDGNIYTWTDNLAIAFGVTIENVTGSAFDDALTGNSAANALSGGGGNDTLSGGGGGDTIDGGTGNDWMDGQGGDDFLVGGSGGVNNLQGGAGTDLISFSGSVANLFVDLSAGAYAYAGGGWDALTSVEGIAGGTGNDTLLGDAGDNLLLGGAGNDTLQGRNGNDALNGEAGNDWLDGGIGNDTLEGGAGVNVLLGGAGIDLASYASQSANLWIDMPAGVYSAAGVWDVFFDSIDGVLGGSGNDSIFGNASDNTLNGAAGNDSLVGNAGNDILIGGAGQDWIVGGDGNDRMIGGTADVDVLTGGIGNDIFDLGAACGWDVAFDFGTSQDSFYLGGLSWLGFVTYDADGDGQSDDTLLGYAGGNFVALNVSGLSLAQWNALVTAGPLSSEAGTEEKITGDPDPLVQPILTDDHLDGRLADGLDRSVLAGLGGQFGLGLETFAPHHLSIRDLAPPDWTPLMA